MQKFELFDETFDSFRTETYELSIQVSLNGFSFCVKDLTRNHFIALVDSPFEHALLNGDDWIGRVTEIVDAYNWLSKPFKKTIFSYSSQHFTLIPQNFFEPERAKQLLSLVSPIPTLDEIRFKPITNDVVSVFSIPSALITAWLKLHGETIIVSCINSTLKHHIQSWQKSKSPLLSVACMEGYAMIILSKNEKLLHCGSNVHKNNEDLAYHLVSICNQFDCKTLSTHVELFGKIDKEEELSTLLQRFFKNVENTPASSQFHFSYLLTDYKKSHATLFNQSLCV
ncbi:MAG: DUF3822 family protein [Tenuifilaceae bacterium]|jgi:hypothetical protein|nr:DUF3822 family protein [Tenuifilaceae bacterium]